MTRTLPLLLLGWLAGCVTVPAQPSDTASSQASPQTCATDAECPGGSCRFNECSPLPRQEEPAPCAADSQCPGGSCRFNQCSSLPPETPTVGTPCTWGNDCSVGICQGIDCH